MTHLISSLKAGLLFAGLAALIFASCGCVVERTVTQNGRVVSEGPAIKRPVRDAINRSQ